MITIEELIEPAFSGKIKKIGRRTQSSSDRIKKLILLKKKIVKYFSEAKNYTDLDNPRLWREFSKQTTKNLSLESHRVFVQDLNAILRILHEKGNIQKIKLKPPTRKFSSSEGFHVEELLDFRFEDVCRLWNLVKREPNEEFVLLFMLTLCSGIPIKHLIHLKVAGVKRNAIFIENKGLIYSILLEPARTELIKYIINNTLTREELVFKKTTQTAFTRWIRKMCRKASIPEINSERLFYFSRFIMVIQGVPAYIVACFGAKNRFSPFSKTISI